MPWTEQQMDRAIGLLLRVGVVTSAAVVLVSATWYHTQADGTAAAYRVFHGVAPELKSATGVIHAAGQGNSAAWIQLGLLLLIATPVARVAYSVLAFALQHDWTYTAITLLVLAVLLYGLW